MSRISVARHHTLGLEQARGKAQALAERLASQYQVKYRWVGDTLEFKRSGADGQIAVSADQVSVQLAPVDRSANAQGDQAQQGQGQQQQFSSQPQAREGGNGGGQRGNEGTGTFGREGSSHEGNTSETAPGLAGGQSVRSGGVYL